MIKQSHFIISLAILTFVLIAASIFLISRHQLKVTADISSLLNQRIDNPLPATANSTLTQGTSTADQILQLQKEIEELKKQPPQVIYKTILTPSSPSPVPDLKTQEELKQAKQQISSLEQKLQQLQTQNPQPTTPAASDADLIRSWQADNKVAQVACQDQFLGTWQLGSGVLISADGKILTNQHVVKPSIGVTLPDYCLLLFKKDFNTQTQTYDKEYRATITGFFQDRDAAQLKIQDIIYHDSNGVVQSIPLSGSLPYFSVSGSAPQIGDPVYVIGYPESAQFAFSVTKGIISNLTNDNLYFGTDAQVDRGNSGGAALNSAGQLVGLPTWKYAGNGDYRGYILNINSLTLTP
jgi:S1-C subfamily serine protease